MYNNKAYDRFVFTVCSLCSSDSSYTGNNTRRRRTQPKFSPKRKINIPTYVYGDVADANGGEDDGKNRVSHATLLQPFGCLMASF